MTSSPRPPAAAITRRPALAIIVPCLLVPCLLVAALSGCTDDGASPSTTVSAAEYWMPLQPGNMSEFLVVSTIEIGGSMTLTDTVRHLYAVASSTVRALDGADIHPVRISWSGSHPDSAFMYPRPASDAVLVYAADLDPAHADTVLRLPFTPGHGWRMNNQPLGRIEIANGDTAVTTPAGRFEHCVCTRTQWTEGDVTACHTQCFARGVGLVRYETLRTTSGGTAMRIESTGLLLSKNF